MITVDQVTGYPTVAAVIVMYNSFAEATVCIASCLAQETANLRVFVVDNGSDDSSAAEAQSRYGSDARFELIQLKPNRGFSGGANAGMRAALECGADYIWLLTDDLDLDPCAAHHLVEAMESDPAAGVAGQYIYHRDERDRIYYGGGSIDESGAGHELMNNRENVSESGTDARETGFVTGASMFFRASVLREIGLMDETYWLYWEDADLSWRVREAGHKILVVPKAKAWHNVTSPTDASMRTRQRYYWRNFMRFQVKHGLETKTGAARKAIGRLPQTLKEQGRRAALTEALSIVDFLRGASGPIRGRW